MNKMHKRLDDKLTGDGCGHDLLETVQCLEKDDPEVNLLPYLT
jgi:hypothetical protein